MGVIRFFLIVMFTLSASLSGAIASSHVAGVGHNHAAMVQMVDDQPSYSLETTQHTQTCAEHIQICHALLALLPSEVLSEASPTTSEGVIMCPGRLMTGIKPSTPLDPPRLV
ncbi:MAG: hypothetical protein CMH03_10155 [Marinovum sp.]|nr:hypothetical protein [Marinovum sp.]